MRKRVLRFSLPLDSLGLLAADYFSIADEIKEGLRRMRNLTTFSTAAIVAVLFVGVTNAQRAPYDLLVRNGRVVDGTGNPWYRADVAIQGDTIVRIAPSITEPAVRVVDVGGQVVAPGFIDIHSHARRGIFDVPTADNYVRQGVTTLMEGPDGGSPVPLAPFLAKLETLAEVGEHRQLHRAGIDPLGRHRRRQSRTRQPTSWRECARWSSRAMKEGAFGLSSGLFYVPGTFTSNERSHRARESGRAVRRNLHLAHARRGVWRRRERQERQSRLVSAAVCRHR